MTDTQFQVGLVYATRGGDRVRVTEIGKGVMSGRWLTGVRKNKTDMWLFSGEYRGDGGTSPHDLLPTPLPDPTDDKAELLAALKAVHALVAEAAMTGFNPKDGNWADRLYASQWETSQAIAKAERTS